MLADLACFGEDSENNSTSQNIFIPHVVGLEYGILVIALCLFCCYMSWGSALDDTFKFDHTHTFHHFLYNFREHHGLEYFFILLLAVAEWVIYMLLYRRAKRRGKYWGSILYFTVLMILHVGICLHANSLTVPNPVPDAAIELGLVYCSFANITVSPSVVYCAVYCWHIMKLESKKDIKNKDEGSPS